MTMKDLLDYTIEHYAKTDGEVKGAAVQIAFKDQQGTAPGTLLKGPFEGSYCLKVVIPPAPGRAEGAALDLLFLAEEVARIEVPTMTMQSALVTPKGAGNIIVPRH